MSAEEQTYEYYQNALAKLPGLSPDINKAEPGFYRTNKGEPVAYFIEQETNRLICIRGRRDKQQRLEELPALELWPWVAMNAVPEAEWRRAYAGGEWDNEAPGLGHNRPPEDSSESESARVLRLAQEWLDKHEAIDSKKLADQAAHYSTELRRLGTDLEREEKEKKKPFQEYVKQLKAHYDALREPLAGMREKLQERLRPYLLKLDAENAEARRKANEAAEKAKAQGKLRQPLESVAPTTRVGGTGHAVSLRSYWRAEITDYLLALECAGDEPEVREAVQAVANRFARKNGGTQPLPGTKAIEDRR